MTTRPFQKFTASRQIVAITGVFPPPVGMTTQGLSSRERRCSYTACTASRW
jgi:hypothetical protein